MTRADNAALGRIVALLDGLKDRGEADELLARARHRLQQLRPPRPLAFTRLLFVPLDGAIVPASGWRRGEGRVPRSALPALSAAVHAALGAEGQAIAAGCEGRAATDTEALGRMGRRLWPAAARVLPAAAPPPEWEAAGLPAAAYPEVAALCRPVWAAGPALHAALAAAPGEASRERASAALTALATAGPEPFAAGLATLMATAPLPGQMARVAAGLDPRFRAVAARQAEAALDRKAPEFDLLEPSAAAGAALALAARLDDLEGSALSAPPSARVVGLSMSLTVRAIEAAKPKAARFRLSDGGGLLLEVRPGGSKGWVCRVTVDGRRRDVGLGTWPDVSLADARTKAREVRQQARSGLDPVEQRDLGRRAARTEREGRREAQARTFAVVAEACIAAQAPGWKHDRTADLWRTSLGAHAFPVLGAMQVGEIDRAAVQRAVASVWATRPATARKVLRRIGSVLRYAAAHGWRANDNPADPRLLRFAGLPSLPAGRNHPSLPWSRVPAFLRALDGMEGMGPLALRWCVLTACRSGEALGARWSELSFDGVPTWTVSPERMKGSRARERDPHRVPLPLAALDLLARARAKATGAKVGPADIPRIAAAMRDALIFPSTKPRTPMLNFALSAVITRMNGDTDPPTWRDAEGRAVVPHGFRSSFRTWVDDTRPEDADAAERALAHEDANAVRGAYRRSDLFDRRIPLMRAWAEWCDGGADRVAPSSSDIADEAYTSAAEGGKRSS